jgi:methionyl-tRNA formyltransferase
MRLIFMGTPEFAVASLARLVTDGHTIAAAFTQPDRPAGRGNKLHQPPVKQFATLQGIQVFQPAKIKTNEEVRAVFKSIDPDACIVAAYGRILPEWMLAIPRLGCINVHASILPRYRGAAPINWAIANGDNRTGVTIMQMDAGMDTGPMLAWREVEIGPEETASELSPRLATLGADLLSETLPRVDRGEIHPVAQNDTEASYAPILKREDGLIDWSLTASGIADRIRGFQPWPGCYTTVGAGRMIVWRARPVIESPPPERTEIQPATITGIDKTGVTVACGNATTLHIEEAQIEGKRRLPARDVINGLRLVVGDTLSDKLPA